MPVSVVRRVVSELPPSPVHVAGEAKAPLAIDPLTVLIAVPTLDIGAADAGALDLVRVLTAAGHKAIVVSQGGRLVPEAVRCGAEFVALNMASNNPVTMLRNALTLLRLVREKRCDLVHAHGRASAWSAFFAARAAHVPFLTSWYKGFREQNVLKRLYNSIMVRGDRVIAVSEQIAQLINDRYGTPWSRICVLPASVDLARFDATKVPAARIEAVRAAWGVTPSTKVILVVGRMLRRKGHHVVVRAVRRLKDRGVKDFLCVFVGEDQGHTHYSGELWDLVLSTKTVDVIRTNNAGQDLAAAYAAATVVVSAAVQPEGMPRSILEAQAMARPVVVSDLGAGPEVVLAPPAVSDDRITGLRFAADDDAGLATALLRVFSMPEPARRAIGERGRAWVLTHFNPPAIAEQTLALYAEATASRRESLQIR
ncbi:MAG TPA: glycosyltransferase [Pseudolabrys sp.]|nr:glycosyltransferase [Pseudolabrys sp.]